MAYVKGAEKALYCFRRYVIVKYVKHSKGLTISDNLTWNAHVSEIIKKASKKLYYLVQLKRARVPPSDLVLFYTSCVRSGVDYAVPVFYNALPQYLKNGSCVSRKGRYR